MMESIMSRGTRVPFILSFSFMFNSFTTVLLFYNLNYLFHYSIIYIHYITARLTQQIYVCPTVGKKVEYGNFLILKILIIRIEY